MKRAPNCRNRNQSQIFRNQKKFIMAGTIILILCPLIMHNIINQLIFFNLSLICINNILFRSKVSRLFVVGANIIFVNETTKYYLQTLNDERNGKTLILIPDQALSSLLKLFLIVRNESVCQTKILKTFMVGQQKF